MSELISLEKGERINLSKKITSLKRVRAVVGWKANNTDTGTDFDIDVSAFVCKNVNDKPTLIGNKWFVFYNNLKTPDGSVVHSGDEKRGNQSNDGDCEIITVDLTTASAEISEISFVVTIHDAQVAKQNFGMIKASYIKLIDDETGVGIAVFDLSEDFSVETAVQVGSLYKKGTDWLFQAVGAGYKTGLDAFVREYGGQLTTM
jgi:tellurium resistance protein TerD